MNKPFTFSELFPTIKPSMSIVLAALTAACSPIVQEARKAEREERIISNEMMLEMYPKSFRPGSPKYLERDFEAGADFICDEIEDKYEKDFCAEPDINWRR